MKKKEQKQIEKLMSLYVEAIPVITGSFAQNSRTPITDPVFTEGFSTAGDFTADNLNWMLGTHHDVLNSIEKEGILSWQDDITYQQGKDTFVTYSGCLWQSKQNVTPNKGQLPAEPSDFWEKFSGAPTSGTIKKVDGVSPQADGDVLVNADNIAQYNDQATTYVIPTTEEINSISGKVGIDSDGVTDAIAMWVNKDSIKAGKMVGYDPDNVPFIDSDTGKLPASIIPAIHLHDMLIFETGLSGDLKHISEAMFQMVASPTSGWEARTGSEPVVGDIAVCMGYITGETATHETTGMPINEFDIFTGKKPSSVWSDYTNWTEYATPLGVVSWDNKYGVITRSEINDTVGNLPVITGMQEQIKVLENHKDFANVIGTSIDGATANIDFSAGALSNNEVLIYKEDSKSFIPTQVLLFK